MTECAENGIGVIADRDVGTGGRKRSEGAKGHGGRMETYETGQGSVRRRLIGQGRGTAVHQWRPEDKRR